MQENLGETQKIIFKAYKSAGKLGGNSGKTQTIILKPKKVQGNSGETQKIIFEAYKNAGKLGGISGETQKIIFEA